MKAADPKPLPNRPTEKLPALPKGTRIKKRPLPRPVSLRNELRRIEDSQNTPDEAGIDGWTPPPRAAYTKVIRVTSGAAFGGLLRRVRDALDDGSGKPSGASLNARVASAGAARTARSQSRQARGGVEDRFDDVVLVATGKAIQKAMDVAAVFTRRADLCVVPRTSTLRAIDDIVAVDENADVEESTRVRNISCLEFGIRWV